MLFTDPRRRRGKPIAVDIGKFRGGIVRIPLVRGKEGSNDGKSILLGDCSGLSPEHRVSVIICYENER